MKIQFAGADRTVTGSCHVVEVNGLKILLDIGLFQGPREQSRIENAWLAPGAEKADCVILSHGHLDHCGRLPLLAKSGFSGPVYCTAATASVARIVLDDSAKIQEEDAAYLNRRTRAGNDVPIRPLYTHMDADASMRLFKHVAYGQKTDLGKGVSFTFFDAGHILGSAYVWLEYEEAGQKRTLLFTADVGRYNSPIIRDPQPLPGPADFVITESTYGDRTHGPIADVGPQLLESIRNAIATGGRVLIPSFAVGRTQTILWYIAKFIQAGDIPKMPVFVDSPMGVEATHAYSQFRDSYDDETLKMIGENDLFGLSNVTLAVTSDESRKINNERRPCVIIASSPTCEFGRILHHLKQSIENPKDLIVFVGWVPYGTLGRRLQNGEPRVRILDRFYERRCQVKTIHGLSAHADRDELLRFLKPTTRKETLAYVVHGEVRQAESFAASLIAAGMGQVVVPAKESTTFNGVVPAASAEGEIGKADGD